MDSMRFDLLKELNNIGSGGALTSLSKFISGGIEIHVPTIKIIDYDKVASTLNYDNEDKLLGVLVNLNGELNATLMFMLTISAANAFISTLLNTPDKDDDVFDEMQMSVVREIANIMFSTYVNTLTTMTGKNLNLSVPYISIDMPQAILSVPAIMYGEIAEKGIFVESVFEISNKEFAAHLVMVPDKESYDCLTKLMGAEN